MYLESWYHFAHMLFVVVHISMNLRAINTTLDPDTIKVWKYTVRIITPFVYSNFIIVLLVFCKCFKNLENC